MGRSVVLGIVCAGHLLTVSAQRGPVVRTTATIQATVTVVASHVAADSLASEVALAFLPPPGAQQTRSVTIWTPAGVELRVTMARTLQSCDEGPAPVGDRRPGHESPRCWRLDVGIASVGT